MPNQMEHPMATPKHPHTPHTRTSLRASYSLSTPGRGAASFGSDRHRMTSSLSTSPPNSCKQNSCDLDSHDSVLLPFLTVSPLSMKRFSLQVKNASIGVGEYIENHRVILSTASDGRMAWRWSHREIGPGHTTVSAERSDHLLNLSATVQHGGSAELFASSVLL